MSTGVTLCFLCDRPARAEDIPAPNASPVGGRSRVTCPNCRGYILHASVQEMSISELVRRQISEMALKQYSEDETDWLEVTEKLALRLMGKPAE